MHIVVTTWNWRTEPWSFNIFWSSSGLQKWTLPVFNLVISSECSPFSDSGPSLPGRRNFIQTAPKFRVNYLIPVDLDTGFLKLVCLSGAKYLWLAHSPVLQSSAKHVGLSAWQRMDLILLFKLLLSTVKKKRKVLVFCPIRWSWVVENCNWVLQKTITLAVWMSLILDSLDLDIPSVGVHVRHKCTLSLWVLGLQCLQGLVSSMLLRHIPKSVEAKVTESCEYTSVLGNNTEIVEVINAASLLCICARQQNVQM